MKDIIHVCCSENAMNAMKNAIQKGMIEGKNILCFCDDLSNGPISEKVNIDQRITWNKNLYSNDDADFVEDLKINYVSFLQNIQAIDDEDIYIWYGKNAKEMCAVMYILSMLGSKLQNIYLINVSEKVYEIRPNYKYSPRIVAEIDPVKLADFLQIKKILNRNTYLSYMEQWSSLNKESSSLRVIKDDKVVGVQESYYDELILRFTSKKFALCTRTVGEVIGRSEQYISDSFIFWRVHELIKNNIIEVTGNLGIMRDMKIKNNL